MDTNEPQGGNVGVVESDGLVPKPGAAITGPESNTYSTLQPENTEGNILDKAADIVTQAEKRDGELTGAPAPAIENIVNSQPPTAQSLNSAQVFGAPDNAADLASAVGRRNQEKEALANAKNDPWHKRLISAAGRITGLAPEDKKSDSIQVADSGFGSGADVPTSNAGAETTVVKQFQDTAFSPDSSAAPSAEVAKQDSGSPMGESVPPMVASTETPVAEEKPVDQVTPPTTDFTNSESSPNIDTSATTNTVGTEAAATTQPQETAVSPEPPVVPATEEKPVDQASTSLTDSTIPESTSPGLNSESSNTQDTITQSPDTQLNSTPPNPDEAAPNVINTPEAVSPPPSFDASVSTESPVDSTANTLTPDINPQASSDAISSQAETQSDTQNPAPPEIPQVPNSVPESLGAQSPIPAGLDHLSDAGHAIVTPQIPNTPSEINANVTDSNVNPFASGSPVGESSTQQTQSTNATEQSAPVTEAGSTANSMNTIEDHATTQPQASVDSTNLTSEIGAQAQVNMPNPLDVSISTPMPDLANKVTEETVTQGQTAAETPDPLAIDAPITPSGVTPAEATTATFGSGSPTTNSTETNINSAPSSIPANEQLTTPSTNSVTSESTTASEPDPGNGLRIERWQDQPASASETTFGSGSPTTNSTETNINSAPSSIPANEQLTTPTAESPAPTFAVTPEPVGPMASPIQSGSIPNAEINGNVLDQAANVAQNASADILTGKPASTNETVTNMDPNAAITEAQRIVTGDSTAQEPTDSTTNSGTGTPPTPAAV